MREIKFRTPSRLRENTERWRKTYKGLTANLYSKIRYRSRITDRSHEHFDLTEFRKFCDENSCYQLWEAWKNSGYTRTLRPSVDRINPLDGYRFPNMQIITAGQNRKKGEQEKIILWGKPVAQISQDNKVIEEFPNIKTAVLKTGIGQGNISSVLHGKRKTAGGYKWRFIKNPDLLEDIKGAA